MYCFKCGKKLDDNSNVCAECGTLRIDEQRAAFGGNAGNTAKYSIYQYEPLWNNWYVKELIGAGSYGKVYLVYREEYGQIFYSAVKHISIPQDDVQLHDLYAEGLADDEVSAQEYYKHVLNNILKEVRTNYELKGQPNIVLYEDHIVVERADVLGYDVFIKMELLTSLSEFIKNNALTEQEVARIGVDICTALEVMSKKKILHRDIKPANIFTTADGVYKLGDFGIARHIEKTMSSMSVKGTFAYMPPEIQKGEKVDRRADVYSLGLVMYKLLNANRAPFLPLPPEKIGVDDNNLAIERRMKGEQLPEPQHAGAEMSRIILKACSYNKEDRWQDASELKQALQNYLTGDSGSAIDSEEIATEKNNSSCDNINKEINSNMDISTSYIDSNTVGLFNTAEPLPDKEKTSKEETISLQQKPINTAKQETIPDATHKSGRPRNFKRIILAAAAVLVCFLAVLGYGLANNSNAEQEKDNLEKAVIKAIEVDIAEVNLCVGESQQLVYRIMPREAADTAWQEKWSSSNTQIATVDSKGKVTAVAEGEATITLTINKIKAEYKVNVVESHIILNYSYINMKIGENRLLSYKIIPEGTDIADAESAWSSSNSSVAVVDSNGKVTAREEGEAIITLKLGTLEAQCAVYVDKENSAEHVTNLQTADSSKSTAGKTSKTTAKTSSSKTNSTVNNSSDDKTNESGTADNNNAEETPEEDNNEEEPTNDEEPTIEEESNTITITIEIQWEDNDNEAMLRPSSVAIWDYNGNYLGSVYAADGWVCSLEIDKDKGINIMLDNIDGYIDPPAYIFSTNDLTFIFTYKIEENIVDVKPMVVE